MRVILFALLCSLAGLASAQFQFFEQMFNQGGQQQQQQQQQAQQAQQNVASDSEWYQRTYESGTYHPVYLVSFSLRTLLMESLIVAHCSNYLCPGTLACVHFPHHCPCPFPAVEDKVELGDGSAICVSKGGWKQGEAARKIELARKGLL